MSQPENQKKVSAISVSEAKKRLPQVKEILEEIQLVFREFAKREEKLRRGADADPHDIAKLRYEVDQSRMKLSEFKLELLDLDCVLKDIKTGLVDFVAVRHGKPVWLCFKQGEEELEYYHEWKAGFAGREEIDFN